MQRVERKKKRTWKHPRLMAAAAAFVLLCGSTAALIFWPREPRTGEGRTVSAQTGENAPEAPSTAAEGTAGAAPAGEPAAERQQAAPAHGSGLPETEEAEAFSGSARGTLTARQPAELDRVTVSRRGKESWTLIRDGEGNMRLKGADWIADERLASRIQDALVNMTYEDIITEDPADYQDRLGEFGLAEPYITAEARFTDGVEITIRLGDEIPVEQQVRYMTMDGDPTLYAVSHALAEDLELSPDALHPVTQPEIYPVLLDRITLFGRDGKETAEWRLRGAVTDQDAGTNWEITAPFRYPADETFIQNLKTSAGNLRMGTFLSEASAERLAEYGLDTPEHRLELHMAAGSTGTVSEVGVYDVVEREGGTVTLEISHSGNEMIDYVRFGDEIFSVGHDVGLSAFLDTKPMDTAARYIAPTPLNSLESMTVERDGNRVTYTLERTGQADPETAEEQVICRMNGEEISREAFSAAYERLMTVTVTGTLPEGWEPKEAHTKYTFRAVSGGTHTAELSSWDGMHDAVTLDGETLFYLIEHGADFTLTAP